MKIENSFEDLYNRLEDRYKANAVLDGEDAVSLASLVNSLESGIGSYNNTLIYSNSDIVKKLNKKIRLTSLNPFIKKNIPYINHVSSVVNENGEYFIDVCFCEADERGSKYIGDAVITSDGKINIDFLRKNFSIDDTKSFLNENNPMFTYSLKLLDEFTREYPNTSYEWIADDKDKKYSRLTDKENPKKFEVKDELLHGYVDLDKLHSTIVTFSSLKDLDLSRTKSRKYGELYDYLDFYKEHYMRRISVDINELNDLYKKIYIKGKEKLKSKEEKDEIVLKRVK